MTQNLKTANTKSSPKTAITPTRSDDFPEWYQQVIRAADMAENSPVRGCMIIKPYGYAVWENMQRIFDLRIKAEGVQNAYFPLLIPMEFIAREAAHVDGFAKECAVVTHHRLESDGKGGLRPAPDSRLEEPYVIRPTSETIIGDAMARWVQSYRDLPLKLNQWCNVMRWEMRTRMFLRTSEFLWQEGHNAFETPKEARDDALKMLQAYVDFVEGSLAIPVITGEKTPEERFPGADATYTIEAIMQDGKALQAGTSHDLGQNFSKGCGIKFQGRDGREEFAYTTSWGISTRLIGALIMTHGDDDGMIMPPEIAPIQVGIIPILKDDAEQDKIIAAAQTLKARLKDLGVRADIDLGPARTPDKMWASIKKGIPIRVELGAQEASADTVTYVMRDLGRESKANISTEQFLSNVQTMLRDLHQRLFAKAHTFRDSQIHDVSDVQALNTFFSENNTGLARMPMAVLSDPDLIEVKRAHGLSARCMPLSNSGYVLIGRSY
jgi:prolyl-tRNA synthetase